MQGGIINTIFALIMAVVLVWVVWGLAIYYSEWGSEEGKREGKSLIMMSVTTLLVVMIVYSIIQWIRNYVGI